MAHTFSTYLIWPPRYGDLLSDPTVYLIGHTATREVLVYAGLLQDAHSDLVKFEHGSPNRPEGYLPFKAVILATPVDATMRELQLGALFPPKAKDSHS